MNWKKLFNFRYILISLYVLITALLLYCGSRAIDHIPELWAAVTGFFHWFRVVLHPLITGFALCYLLSPVVSFFEQRLAGFRTLLPRALRRPAKQEKTHPFRGFAVLLTFTLVLLVLTLLLSLLISALSSSVQLANLSDLWRMTKELSLAISNFYQDVLNKLATLPVAGNDFTAYLKSAVSNLMSFAERFLGSMLSSVNNMGSFFSNLLFSLIFCVYFLLDGENILRYWKRVSKVLLGQRINRALSVFFSDADRAFAGYIRGQVIDALIMAVLVSVSLSIIGVRYGLIIGIAGERVVNNHKFYAVFQENVEYTVRTGSETLGTIVKPPPAGEKIAIAGRVWAVDEVDHKAHTVLCTLIKGRVPAYFGDVPGSIETHILERMRKVLLEEQIYPYLQRNAAGRLLEARTLAARTRLKKTALLPLGEKIWALFPWLGSYAFLALERFLKLRCKERLGLRGFTSARPYYMIFSMEVGEEEFFEILLDEAEKDFAPEELLYEREVPVFEKFDCYVPEELVRRGFARGVLDLETMLARVRGRFALQDCDRPAITG